MNILTLQVIYSQYKCCSEVNVTIEETGQTLSLHLFVLPPGSPKLNSAVELSTGTLTNYCIILPLAVTWYLSENKPCE